jgi:DNA-binding NarL/FixJ family response regulator
MGGKGSRRKSAGRGTRLRVSTFELGSETVLVASYPKTVEKKTKSLTAAEQDVLRLLLTGSSNAEIARARNKSSRTVCNQVASIFRKFDVSSRLELARKLDALGDTGEPAT